MKKMIAFLISSIIAMVCISFNADAKVIEPEVVKTEKWTTSYYIDDDIDTLYPYIQCEADIYNDGTIKLYMWNTHEWDGFATVKNKITLQSTAARPLHDNELYYLKEYGTYNRKNTFEDCTVIPISKATFEDMGSRYYTDTPPSDTQYLDYLDVSYYPDNYEPSRSDLGYLGGGVSVGDNFFEYSFSNDKYYTASRDNKRNANWSHATCGIARYTLTTALCNFKFSSVRSHVSVTFTPITTPTEKYNFRLFGHDITITPELLSGNVVSEPVLTEQEQYIKQLEEENKKLKEQLNLLSRNSCGDIDGDGDISVEDAQLLLQYYTESKVAQLTDKPIKDWYAEKYGSK